MIRYFNFHQPPLLRYFTKTHFSCIFLIVCIRSFQPDYDDHVSSDSRRLKPFSTSRSKEKSKDNKKYGKVLCLYVVHTSSLTIPTTLANSIQTSSGNLQVSFYLYRIVKITQATMSAYLIEEWKYTCFNCTSDYPILVHFLFLFRWSLLLRVTRKGTKFRVEIKSKRNRPL